MPWLFTVPTVGTYTCDAFDTPKDGSIHIPQEDE